MLVLELYFKSGGGVVCEQHGLVKQTGTAPTDKDALEYNL